jgi:uncharacterized protein YgfB (UPF0149 family)
MNQAAFAELADLFDAVGASASAAECHGVLCGALCVHEYYPVERWLDDVIDADAPAQLPPELVALHRETMSALASDDLRFQPLLPDDEVPLRARALALGEWSHGFLYGFGTRGGSGPAGLPPDVTEILTDFGELSRAVADDDEPDEASEAAYAELVEFVRAGVQLVHEELAAHRSSDRG